MRLSPLMAIVHADYNEVTGKDYKGFYVETKEDGEFKEVYRANTGDPTTDWSLVCAYARKYFNIFVFSSDVDHFIMDTGIELEGR